MQRKGKNIHRKYTKKRKKPRYIERKGKLYTQKRKICKKNKKECCYRRYYQKVKKINRKIV